MAAFLNRPEMLSYENPLNQAIRDFQGITSPDPAHVLRRLAAKAAVRRNAQGDSPLPRVSRRRLLRAKPPSSAIITYAGSA